MFALALVNVDADPPAPPPTPPPRRPASRPTPTADPMHSTGTDRIDGDQYTHKTATRQRWHWSTSIQSHPGRDHPETAKVQSDMFAPALVDVDAVPAPG